MIGYMPQDEKVARRALKVQSLSIPIKIVGNATAASVVPSNDEPAFCFIKTEGVDQITGALLTNETATYSVAAADATGNFSVLIRVKENVAKNLGAEMVQTDGLNAQFAQLGSASGITTGTAGGQALMYCCKTSVALNASNTFNGLLTVYYAVSEGN